MKLIVKSFGRTYPCALKEFKINRIDARDEEFGEVEHDECKEQYTCSNRRFVPKLPKQEILNKYNISLADYEKICDELRSVLRVYHCGMCI